METCLRNEVHTSVTSEWHSSQTDVTYSTIPCVCRLKMELQHLVCLILQDVKSNACNSGVFAHASLFLFNTCHPGQSAIKIKYPAGVHDTLSSLTVKTELEWPTEKGSMWQARQRHYGKHDHREQTAARVRHLNVTHRWKFLGGESSCSLSETMKLGMIGWNRLYSFYLLTLA